MRPRTCILWYNIAVIEWCVFYIRSLSCTIYCSDNDIIIILLLLMTLLSFCCYLWHYYHFVVSYDIIIILLLLMTLLSFCWYLWHYYHFVVTYDIIIISLLLMTSLSLCWYFINLRNIIVLVTDELQDDIYLEWFTSEVKMMFPDAFSGTTPFNHKVSQTLLRSQS